MYFTRYGYVPQVLPSLPQSPPAHLVTPEDPPFWTRARKETASRIPSSISSRISITSNNFCLLPVTNVNFFIFTLSVSLSIFDSNVIYVFFTFYVLYENLYSLSLSQYFKCINDDDDDEVKKVLEECLKNVLLSLCE